MDKLRKTSLHIALAIAAASFLAVSTATIGADPPKGKKERHFKAKLDAAQEVPLISSLATGEFEATLNGAENQISFDLSWEDLEGGVPTAAHVHLGQPGVMGGVMFFLCGGSTKPACPAMTSGSIHGTVVAADVIGPGGQGIAAGEFAEVIRAMRGKEMTYANIHTAAYPNGEIRGIVKD